MAKQRKRNNVFKEYFSEFGLRQICDIVMLVGAITIIVGLFVAIGSVSASEIILLVGIAIYIVASGLAITRAVLVLVSNINHRAPEYKRAIVNTVIMSIIFALAVFALVWLIVTM